MSDSGPANKARRNMLAAALAAGATAPAMARLITTNSPGTNMAGNLLPQPAQIFQDASRNSLAGGLLYTYAAGTLTPKTTYQDAALTIANPNPTVASARGEVLMFGLGAYRIILKDKAGTVIYDVDNIESAASLTSALSASLAASSGADQVGWMQSGDAAVRRSVQNKLLESVTPYDFGAIGDGVADDTNAIQRATNTGKAVNFLSGTFRMLSTVSYKGKINWFSTGHATILCDDIVVSVQSGTGSRISAGIAFNNITAPWIIKRDPANWNAVPVVAQSNGLGYQPTVNDGDVWTRLTTAQKTQDIGPKIVFQGDSSDIVVDGITGRFLSILIYDAQNSAIKNCNYQGGKSFAGSAVFWNINNQIGSGNRIINNTIRAPSFSGGVMSRNNDGEYSGNNISFAGESGLKTCQNDLAGVDARCRRMKMDRNDILYCYYDSIDAATNYPVDGTVDCQHQITNNDLFGSRQVGIFGDGQLCQLAGNKIRRHGKDGIRGFYNQSQINGNLVVDNNKSNTKVGVNHINVDGNGNTISDNKIRTFGNLGAAIYATGANYAFGNTCNDGGFFFGNVGAINSLLTGNGDAISTMVTTVPQRIRQNNAGVPALELYSDVPGVPVVAVELHPRHGELRNPIGRMEGFVSFAVDNAEYGGVAFYGASNGVLQRGAYIATNSSVPNFAWPVLTVPKVAVTPAMIEPSSISFWVDEVTNKLNVTVRYANGTGKTGSILLT